MDSKEIKVHLKEAREAIRSKDYTKALEHCQNVLRVDKKNYSALVFVGVANQELGELDEAAKAFKQAIELAPQQILAWQGWCAFCEKNSDLKYKSELLTAYTKMLELQNDKNKKVEITGKLARLYLENKDIEKYVRTLETQLEFSSDDEQEQKEIHKSIVNVLGSEDKIPSDLQNSLQRSLKIILSSGYLEDFEEIRHFLNINLNVLLKANKLDEAVNEATKLLEIDGSSILAREVLCSSFVGSVIEKENVNVEQMKIIIDELLQVESDNHVAKMAELGLCLITKNYQSLLIHLSKNFKGSSIDECLLLIMCSDAVHQYQNTLIFSNQGLQLCKRSTENKQSDKTIRFELAAINAQLQMGLKDNIEKNISTLEKMIKTDKKNRTLCELLLKSYIKIGKLELAKKIIAEFGDYDDLKNLLEGYSGMIYRREGNLEEAKQKLDNSLKRHQVHSLFSLELGIILRELNQLSKSLVCFLTALKEDPYNPQLFLQLGHHYTLTNDKDKAQRCYKKSYQLNSHEEEICLALSDSYWQNGQNVDNYNLLKQVTGDPMARSWKWAWLRLGLHEYHADNLTDAVKSLQSALRIDPKDSHCWESLADVYTVRGSYTAALKSYSRSLELNPDSIYCYYQMAKIRQLLQEYSQAVTEYKVVLSKDMNYVPAMKGYSEAKLLQTSFYLEQCLHGLAKDCCEDAIDMLTSAIFLQPDLICLWKLLGDGCTLTRHFSPELYKFQIPNKLAKIFCLEETLCERKTMLNLGVRCYGKALSIGESAELWQDVGINYCYQAENSEDANVKTEKYEKAFTSLKKAVTFNPQHGGHWNSLGVVAAKLKNFELAQHSFINAIQNEENNVVAWTNLGVLYLINDNFQLANKAFSMSQSIEPTYANCWIGQAIIAEQVGHADAMDLFRHTTSLDNHAESAIGYAHWTINTLLSTTEKNSELYEYWMNQLAAVPAASDCMIKYTGHINKDSLGLNMLGLLLEKQNLNKGAKLSFEKSLELLKAEETSNIDYVRSNYARVLTKLGRYQDAIKQFELVKKPDFSSQCGLGLCHFKSSNFEDSFQAYEAALHWFSTNDEEKAHVLVAMASVAYKLNKIDTVKTLLFQSSQLQPPSVPGILALCAVGLLQADITLIQVTLKELVAYAKNPSYLSSVSFLIASTVLLQGKNNLGQRFLSKALHEFPWQDKIWSMMGQILLQFRCSGSKVADKCALNAVVLARNSLKTTAIKSSVYEIATLVLLCQLASGNEFESLKRAQKTVHLNPTSVSNWAGLMAAVVANDGNYEKSASKDWFKKLLDFTIQQVSTTVKDQPLFCWLHWYRCLLKMSINSNVEAEQSIKKVENCNSNQPRIIAVTSALREILQYEISSNENTRQLELCLANCPDFTFGWQTLMNIFVSEGNLTKLTECVERWRILADQIGLSHVALFAVIVFANFIVELKDKGPGIEAAERILTETAKFSTDSAVVYSLLAKLNHMKNEKKKVKKYLQLVLSKSKDVPRESCARLLAKKILES